MLLFSCPLGHTWLHQSKSISYLLVLFPCSLKLVQIRWCVLLLVPYRALLLFLARRVDWKWVNLLYMHCWII